MIRFVFSLRNTIIGLIILIISVTRESELGLVNCFLICCSNQKIHILRNLMMVSPLSHIARFGLHHSPYSLLFTFSDVLCKGNQDTSFNSKQEMGRNVLGMNLSSGIFSCIFPKFENNDYKRHANVNGFKNLLMKLLIFAKRNKRKISQRLRKLVIYRGDWEPSVRGGTSRKYF